MNVRVIDGAHPEFAARAKFILDIYNRESDSGFDETLTVTSPSSIRIIFIDGVEGGVIADRWSDRTGKTIFFSIMFAAFNESDRKKGYLSACIQNSELQLETVQVQEGDPIEVWKKLGFKKAGMMSGTLMLRTRDFDGVVWGSYNEIPI